MIPSKSIDAFFKRPRQDFRKFKSLTVEQVEARKRALPIVPPVWEVLKLHQKVCLLIGAEQRRFAYLNDTGTGKTLLSIALAEYFDALEGPLRALVLVPSRINKDEWAREIVKHGDTSYCVLHGSSDNKWKQLRTDALLYIDTYDGFVRMVTKSVKRKKSTRLRLVPDPRALNRLQKFFRGIILDEALDIKNKAALPYRICNKLSKTASFVFTLTGTPFGRDPQDLWAQMFVVDKGYTLGETLGLYRAAFFKEQQTLFAVKYKFDDKKKQLLNRILANCSIRYIANQADLPRVVPIYKFVSLPHDAQEYYNKARSAILQSGGSFRDMKNAFLRMRQISSGFVGYYDDDAGAKAQFVFPENPKLELLLSTINSIRKDAKIVVFNEFLYSGRCIAQGLKELGIGHQVISGETKDTAGALRAFDHDPRCRVLILSNSMAIGLNLQVASYGIFYESPVRVTTRKQARRRIERQESKHDKVFLYDLIVQGTVDQQILQFHRHGEDLFQAIIEGVVKPF